MSIKFKLIILFLVFASIPMFIIGAITFRNYENSLKAGHISALQDIVFFKADKIETYFASIKANIGIAQGFNNIKRNLPILTRLSKKTDNPEFHAAQKMLDSQLSVIQAALGLADIMLVNPEGRIVYSRRMGDTSVYLNTLPDPGQKSFAEGKKGVYITDIFFNKAQSNKLSILVAAPAVDLNDVFTGVIVFEIDIDQFYGLIQDVTGLGKTGETLLGKRIGNEVLYLNPLRHDSGSFSNRRITIGSKISIPIQEATQGRTGAGLSIDYRMQKVVAAWRYIPSLGLGIVAKIDAREAFSDVEKLRKLFLMVMFYILVLVYVTTSLISDSIARPINKLIKGAQIVGGGNLDHKIDSDRRDEIGQLSRAFDKMTHDLQKTTASRDDLNKEIDVRKRVEEKLRESETLYRSIGESIDYGVWVCASDGRNTYASESFLNMVGLTQEQCSNFGWGNVLHPEDAERTISAWKECVRTGGTWDIEHRFRGVDGQWHHVLARGVPVKNQQGEILCWAGINLDISRLKQAEEALRQSQEDLTRAQTVGNIGNWRLNVQRNELIWSEENYRIFGIPIGTPLTYEIFLSTIHPDDRDYVNKKWKAGMAGEDYDIEHRITVDGKVKWVREKAYLEFDKKGALLAGFGITQDITSLKKAEEILRRDKEVLEKLVHEKAQELTASQKEIDRVKRLSDIGTLAATVAHELRNPLADIGLLAYHINKIIKDPRVEGDLNTINRRISEADQIINNVLLYSKIKIGRFQTVKINSILKECIDGATGRISGQNITVNVKIDRTKNLTISADPLQIKEVFSNILNNAFDALNKNAGIIDIESQFNDSTVSILIKDNGEGIEKEHLRKVFEPFFTTKTKGTGLGLAVCYQIILLHDGSITIESDKGKGTTVIVTLTIQRQKDAKKNLNSR